MALPECAGIGICRSGWPLGDVPGTMPLNVLRARLAYRLDSDVRIVDLREMTFIRLYKLESKGMRTIIPRHFEIRNDCKSAG
jgi:hypothetical protein